MMLYYTHIPTTILALLVGLFVFINDPKSLKNKFLFALSVSFSLWTFSNLILWTNIHSDFILFAWTIYQVLFGLICVLSVLLTYSFIKGNNLSTRVKSMLVLLISPLLIFAPSYLNLGGFDISNCDAFMFEGEVFKVYTIILGVLSMTWIAYVYVRERERLSSEGLLKESTLMIIGIEFFLFTFFSIVFTASYLTEMGFLPDSSLEFYGLYGMTFFMGVIAYLIVKYNTFNSKLLAAQALVTALIIVIGSEFFFVESLTNHILVGITFVFACISGYFLVRSVKKEVRLRMEVEDLAQDLARANEKLKDLDKLKSEFVSIASHQLRAPLTAIRGYASMLLDGSFGTMPGEANTALERISESAKNMAYSVEDYLNVSRIESGNMKYSYSDFNLRDEVEHVCDDLRPQALHRGLVLLFRTDLKSQGVINADVGKTIQIIQNLINNSIKYTEKGSIKVLVRDDVVRKRIYVDIEDTGIGMNEETKAKLFGKFERATNANAVNHGGTGLGLYVAYAMAKGMNGNITTHSEGDGKGSRFTIEFPLAM